MVRALQDVIGLECVGPDGGLGEVADVYFDDDSWTVRYLVVTPGDIERTTPFLVSPIAVSGLKEHAVRVDVTRDQAMRAPEMEADEPVSRQMERSYSDHFGWSYYWAGAHPWGRWATPIGLGTPGPGAEGPGPVGSETVPPVEGAQDRVEAETRREDVAEEPEVTTTLRSVQEVRGYHVQALDDEIGHVEEFLVDDESWYIHCIVVDTSNWWFGKKVTVPTERFTHIDWIDRKISVEETRDSVKASLEYHDDHPSCGHRAA